MVSESKSPYASPVVLVKKKDKTLRVCVDFRKLNARTVKDSYPIPRIAETLQALSGAEWFCSLDLQSGYLQVKIASGDKTKTAMTTPFGLYEFNRMPFGLTNAPATFQRLMESCLGDLNFRTCLVYLDDVIVFARSFPEMLERLEEVLRRLGEYGLKLKTSKCKLFQRKLTYLGHVVSAAGVEPDPEKTKPTVIAYGSRTLSSAERNYSAYRREFLALKWAATEKFRDYLYGSKFHVVTDSNPLTYLVISAKLSPTDYRWLSSLVAFDFDISYRCGKANGDADGLSRIPVTDEEGNQDSPTDEEYVKPFLDRLKPLQESAITCLHEFF